MPVGPPILTDLSAVFDEPLAPIEWVVEPLIPVGTRTLVYGEAGSLKSWMLIDLGLHLALGKPWLGRYACPHPMRVVYVDEEMPERTLRRRLWRMGAYAGVDTSAGRGPVVPFKYINRHGLVFSTQGADELYRTLRGEFWPHVIILETFRQVFIGSEINPQDVRAFWKSLEPFCKEGVTVIVSHHMNKPTSNGYETALRYRASGSMDLIAGADMVYALVRKGPSTALVEPVKGREAAEAEAFTFELDEPEGPEGPVGLQWRGTKDDWVQANAKGHQGRVRVLEYLHEHEGSAQRKDLLALGIPKSTLYVVLKELKESGQIFSPQAGVWQINPHPPIYIS